MVAAVLCFRCVCCDKMRVVVPLEEETMNTLRDLFLDNLVGLQLMGAEPVRAAKCIASLFLMEEKEAVTFGKEACDQAFAACCDLRVLTILKTRHLYSTSSTAYRNKYSELLLDAKERVLNKYMAMQRYVTSFEAETLFANCKNNDFAAELSGLGIYFGLTGPADQRVGKEVLRGAEYTSPVAMLFFLWNEPQQNKQQYLDRLSSTPFYWRNSAELTNAFVSAYGIDEPHVHGVQTRIGF